MQDQDGAVALETALVLPLVALVVAAVLGATSVVVDQLAVTRAARAAARTVALTGAAAQAPAAAEAVAPGARTDVALRGGVATVTVALSGDVLGVGYQVGATAVAPLEPGVDRRARLP